jgi:tripartite-type tricarboxylate transporter receptor subunit TctC
MVLYPAGTPAPLVKSTFDAVNASMRVPEVEQRLVAVGALPRYNTSPGDAAAYLRSEYKT